MDFDLSATQCCVIFQDAEYIKVAGVAWEEAVVAKSEDGWREEKSDKKMVSITSLPYFTLYCKAEIKI